MVQATNEGRFLVASNEGSIVKRYANFQKGAVVQSGTTFLYNSTTSTDTLVSTHRTSNSLFATQMVMPSDI